MLWNVDPGPVGSTTLDFKLQYVNSCFNSYHHGHFLLLILRFREFYILKTAIDVPYEEAAPINQDQRIRQEGEPEAEAVIQSRPKGGETFCF